MSAALWRKCAHELAELIRSKQVSSREVIQGHLDRIAAVNDKVNAITVTLAESALLAADRADASRPTGPFHGAPFTIKENIDCTGSATTQGLPAFAAAMPAADAPVVARTKAAGAIPLGRTNLPRDGAAHCDGQSVARPHQQSVGSHPDHGRFERWRGRRARHRNDSDRPRQRHRRVAAQPGLLLRDRRAQIHCRQDSRR